MPDLALRFKTGIRRACASSWMPPKTLAFHRNMRFTESAALEVVVSKQPCIRDTEDRPDVILVHASDERRQPFLKAKALPKWHRMRRASTTARDWRSRWSRTYTWAPKRRGSGSRMGTDWMDRSARRRHFQRPASNQAPHDDAPFSRLPESEPVLLQERNGNGVDETRLP